MDGRFTVKITDFGWDLLKNVTEDYQQNPWTCPELLRGHSLTSQKCDIYSYGIILHEIVFREGVFNTNENDLEYYGEHI